MYITIKHLANLAIWQEFNRLQSYNFSACKMCSAASAAFFADAIANMISTVNRKALDEVCNMQKNK